MQSFGWSWSRPPNFVEAIRKTINSDFDAIQIQVDLNSPFNISNAIQAKNLAKKFGVYLVIHGNVCYNLAGKTNPKDSRFMSAQQWVITSLAKELDIGVALDCGVVAHIGSCIDKNLAPRIIANTITSCLKKKTRYTSLLANQLQISEDEVLKRRKLFLENCAGEGNKYGKNCEEIDSILNLLPSEILENVSVCWDTTHCYGAGVYDFGKVEDVQKFQEDVSNTFGTHKLSLFHLNDSSIVKNAYFGSRLDRHETLGEGYIFRSEENLKSLKQLLKIFETIPFISETPNPIHDRQVLNLLTEI